MVAAFGRLALFIYVFCLAGLSLATSARATDGKIRLLFFSSHPEIMQSEDQAGLAHLATAIQQAQAEDPESYFIYGGAALGPSLLGVLDKGAHMVDILNSLQPEFMAVMKREFSYGLDHLALNAMSSAFPLVTSNLIDARTGETLEGIEPYYLLIGTDLNVGFIVLTSHNAIIEYGATDAHAIDMDAVVADYAAELRDLGADAIFLIADTDYDDVSSYREAGTVDGIFYTHNFGNPHSLDHQGELHTQGALDGQLIILELARMADGSLTSKASFRDIATAEPDPVVNSLIQSYRSRLAERLRPTIATLGTSFDTLRSNIRTGESAFGNFAADVLRGYVGADVFLLNSGAIRGNRAYTAGSTISRGDIQRELPFGNRTSVLRLTGADLRRTLEFGIGCYDTVDGCALQVSNVTIRYDANAPAGQRITDLAVGGVPVSDDASYTVGLSDFLAAGNDGFEWLGTAERVPTSNAGRTIWDLLAAHCEEVGTINPQKDGRIQEIGQQE